MIPEGGIDLDPATSEIAQKTVRAKRYFTKEQDGLAHEWHGKVWLAPPFSDMPRWIDKLIGEFRAGRTTEAIVLTNACTDTAWFDQLRSFATAICFTRGRIKFFDAHGKEAPNSPLLGQALFYLGPRPDEFARHFSAIGWVADPTRYRDLAAHRKEVVASVGAGCLTK